MQADWANMGAECKRLEDAGVDRIQFDVMDGNVRSAPGALAAHTLGWTRCQPDATHGLSQV